MALHEDLAARIESIASERWSTRAGLTVPKSEDVALAGGGVTMTATMLYADLADSTTLATRFDPRVAAMVIKLFLGPTCDIIRYHQGHIRSFDGDRVMGVFMGANQEQRAVRAAMHIFYAVHQLMRPALDRHVPGLARAGYLLTHGVGIDRSEVMAARAGIRRNNDLVWIGRAPNVAAKLSALRSDPYATHITPEVFGALIDPATKVYALDGRSLWEVVRWPGAPTEETALILRSRWMLRPPSGALLRGLF
ncbi:adenylate/guanylate cyclase domain-containing protein [Luteibacter sp. CQ10]|uniref:adenylate/guanylate cyclase domain-containing protein n=1 Tax=Luteibacter sp. CQ10 TaxID=2805821 RepID=UPI0034A1AE3C